MAPNLCGARVSVVEPCPAQVARIGEADRCCAQVRLLGLRAFCGAQLVSLVPCTAQVSFSDRRNLCGARVHAVEPCDAQITLPDSRNLCGTCVEFAGIVLWPIFKHASKPSARPSVIDTGVGNLTTRRSDSGDRRASGPVQDGRPQRKEGPVRILLSHWTALTLYRRGWVLEGSPPAEPIDPCDAWKGAPGGKASNRALTQVLASCGCCPPIHTLVPASGHRSGAHGFASHCLPRGVVDARATRVRLPASEQLKDAETYVVSPELLFLELARLLGEVGAALLGMELCGRYLRADPQDPREQVARAGFASRREPLMARGGGSGRFSWQAATVRGGSPPRNRWARACWGRSPLSHGERGLSRDDAAGAARRVRHRETPDQREDGAGASRGARAGGRPPGMGLRMERAAAHGHRVPEPAVPRHSAASPRRPAPERAGVRRGRLARLGPADVMDPVAFETNCLNVARLRGRPFRTELRDFEQRYRRLHSLLFGSGADVG